MLLKELLPAADRIQELDLDRLQTALAEADRTMEELLERLALYETELQRELRAKIELCGPSPLCPGAEAAFTLTGRTLLAARHEAAQKFNQVFFMAPLCRHAQKPHR